MSDGDSLVTNEATAVHPALPLLVVLWAGAVLGGVVLGLLIGGWWLWLK